MANVVYLIFLMVNVGKSASPMSTCVWQSEKHTNLRDKPTFMSNSQWGGELKPILTKKEHIPIGSMYIYIYIIYMSIWYIQPVDFVW